MKRILGMTSIRSDYDLMSGVYRRLSQEPDVDFKVLVSGAHLSAQYGYSIDLIKNDGLDILADVETLINGDSKAARLKTASGLLSGALDLVKNFHPDVLIYAGDREDVLIGAMLGAFLDIPTVHFFGGDHAADGHVDNPVRHATSKLSTAHFVSIQEHANRLACLGEDMSRVFVIGSVALDKFVAEPRLDRDATLSGIGAKSHAFQGPPLAILIFHPVDQERQLAPSYVRDATEILIERGFHVLIGAPNADPGNAPLLKTMHELARVPEVTFYGNMARLHFVNLMRHAALMVGNSSAGILEAASVALPVINLGERQRGRLCGQNVIFCDGDPESITKALSRISDDGYTAAMHGIVNPYGDGHSEARAVDLLKRLDFASIFKKTEDPLYVHS
ncbi:UDP-N-acetylglucosamine 2-epimerase [Chromobacterium haemolyticum]|uniref:UDP-N-acetylglucosamine 2-epimerase n=1 Tax=Chromobacterium haemolyticum TaxID=394935 RepID=UPI0009DB0757|nr:UDP-N-acetylglucosamine 2-epimerase [Chromobacterium haemolyticum]OQS42499.1 UDP-N-acetylglucosamine 2-epimerase (hydrolyzing) [Chromobacterium haemolyticum]